MELDRAIKERHTVRKFSTKSVDWRDVIKAIDRARLAPLAGNLPTLKFMLILDKEKIKQISAACQQEFVGKSQYLIIICSDASQIIRSYDERAKIYARQQAGAAIENFLLKLTELDLATCWIGYFSDELVKKALAIPEKIEVEAIFPIGYEMPPKGKQRIKPDLDSMMFFDKWGNKHMTPLKKPEAY